MCDKKDEVTNICTNVDSSDFISDPDIPPLLNDELYQFWASMNQLSEAEWRIYVSVNWEIIFLTPHDFPTIRLINVLLGHCWHGLIKANLIIVHPSYITVHNETVMAQL